jgi:hypothetical protein
MSVEIPEALAVLDEWIELAATPAADVRMNHDIRKARAAFAELYRSTLPHRREIGLSFDEMDRIERALNAVENLK